MIAPFPTDAMSHVTELIPEADRVILSAAFREDHETLPKMTAEEFIDDIIWRVYTEICCSPGGRHIQSPYPAAGIAFKQWVEKEVHYALEGTQIDDAKFQEVRRSILQAVAARAKELFGAWDGKTYPRDKSDTRNLRTSLRPYLPVHLKNESRPSPACQDEGIDPSPTIEQKPDGSTELRWAEHDASTVVVAKGTPERPIPELLAKDPRRAADLVFGTWSEPRGKSTEASAEEAMPVVPERARSLTIDTSDVGVAHDLGMQLMMATGTVTARNGNAVSLPISSEIFPKVWEACKKYGITGSMLRFT